MRLVSPMMPMMVSASPWLTLTRRPLASTQAMKWSSCSVVALSLMTAIMARPFRDMRRVRCGLLDKDGITG